MTQKRKSLIRLRDARGRLRDLEAARTAMASMHLDEQERQLVTANRDLVTAVQRACDQLAEARAVTELEEAHQELGSARDQVAEARQQVIAAAESRHAAAEHLGKRERELRITERVLDGVTTAERRDGDRSEQRMVDDLVGARLARGDL
jgi:hypothetical protein